jgi:serine/threonine-protein kinase
LEDVFAIQSEIASKVADELKVKLVDSEKRMLERKATENTEAYTRFLEARELDRQGGEESLRKAEGVLAKVIELDPSFAMAHSELANVYLRLGNGGYEPYEQSILRAKMPLRRALDLDPDLAEAHATLAWMLFNEDDGVGAETEARKAMELNPSLPEAYDQLSNVMWAKGNQTEGTRLVEAYYHLDPLRPGYVIDYGSLLFYTGRESEALEHWKKTAELAPAGTYMLMAEYYLSKKDYSKAKELHSMVEKLDPNRPWVDWVRGFMAAKMGDRETALQVIRKIESKAGVLRLNEAAFVYYGLGDMASFFDNLNRAIDLHGFNFLYAMYSPLFAEGRNDPRYQVLIEKMRKVMWPMEE